MRLQVVDEASELELRHVARPVDIDERKGCEGAHALEQLLVGELVGPGAGEGVLEDADERRRT